MGKLRDIIQFGIAAACMGLVVAGLYMSMGSPGEGTVLDRPGAAARLERDNSSATAFFEIEGDAMELTMLFSEPDDPDSVFKTRVRLIDGQTHSVVIGEPDDIGGSHRYTFRRVGYTVEMHLAPINTLQASFN